MTIRTAPHGHDGVAGGQFRNSCSAHVFDDERSEESKLGRNDLNPASGMPAQRSEQEPLAPVHNHVAPTRFPNGLRPTVAGELFQLARHSPRVADAGTRQRPASVEPSKESDRKKPSSPLLRRRLAELLADLLDLRFGLNRTVLVVGIF